MSNLGFFSIKNSGVFVIIVQFIANLTHHDFENTSSTLQTFNLKWAIAN